jgi:hypothetical protein
VIETFTVLDMTRNNLSGRIDIGSWGSGKVHAFDNEPAAKRRRTLIANKYPKQEFAILKTTITDHGGAFVEWLHE